jgi:hypothetical protein
MADIATNMMTAMNRAMVAIMDDIAKEGLEILKSILDSSGFAKSEYLKNYEVYAHATDTEILYEIVLDFEAVEAVDPAAKEALEESSPLEVSESARTYGVSSTAGPQRIIGRRDARRDARRPARDARRPARDARRTSKGRNILRAAALRAPRSLDVTKKGKLAVTLRKSTTEDEEGTVRFPKGQFQGIVGAFVEQLSSAVAAEFAPQFQAVLSRYVA